MKELAYKSASELIRGYKTGRFSPLEVLDAVLDRVDECEGRLNAWRLIDRRRARRRAQLPRHAGLKVLHAGSLTVCRPLSRMSPKQKTGQP